MIFILRTTDYISINISIIIIITIQIVYTYKVLTHTHTHTHIYIYIILGGMQEYMHITNGTGSCKVNMN